MTPDARNGRMFYGYWIMLLMLYVLFFAGGMGFYTYSVFVPRFEEAFGWTRFQVVGPSALWAVVYGFSGFFVGAWIQRFGARRVFVAGTVAAAVTFAMISMVNHLWQLFVALGLAGIAAAATTLVPAQTVITMWFNRMRGRAMGFALMGIGVGGMALPPLVAVLIQSTGWRNAYRISALILVVFVLPPVLLLLKNRPADVGEVPDGRAATMGEAEVTHRATGVPARRAVRSLPFWLLFFTYLLQLYVISAINVNTTAFAEGAGYTPLAAPLFMALAVGISVPGRFLYGWLSDRIAPTLLMATVGVLLAVSTAALDVLVIRLGITGSLPIWVFALTQGLGIAGSTVVLPILVGRCFGDLEFGKIQGLVMAGFAVGVILGGPSAAKIFDVTGTYSAAFWMCTACGLAATVLVSMVRPAALHDEFQSAPAATTSPLP